MSLNLPEIILVLRRSTFGGGGGYVPSAQENFLSLPGYALPHEWHEPTLSTTLYENASLLAQSSKGQG